MKTKNKYPVILIFLIFLDRVIATFLWGFESNPLLLDMGIFGMWVVTIPIIISYLCCYYWVYNSRYKLISAYLSLGLITLYTIVIVTNLWYIVVK